MGILPVKTHSYYMSPVSNQANMPVVHAWESFAIGGKRQPDAYSSL